jgi:hypothetical protein
MKNAALVVFALCLQAAPAFAQGVIAGRVVTTDTPPQPVRRAIVMVKGGSTERGLVTNDDGGFEFADLPVNRYILTVVKPAYVATAYGATRPGGPGAPIAVNAGQRVELSVTMLAGAVLEGRITGSTGEPVPGAFISVRAVQNGAAARTVVASVKTDDRGIYRAFGLAPGSYVIGASIPTGIYTAGRPQASDVDAALARLAARTPAQPTPPANPASLLEPDGPVNGFGPVYYPGVPYADDALAVTVAAGQERGGLDFIFAPARRVTIEGHLAGAIRNFRAVQMTLQPMGAFSSGSAGSATPEPDGAFAFRNVPPGRYTINARVRRTDADAAPAPPPPGPRIQITSLTTPAGEAARTAGEDFLYAVADVDARGERTSRVSLTILPGGTINGRIALEPGATPPDLQPVQVRVLPEQVSGPSMILSGSFTMQRSAPVREDRGFTVTSIAPGKYTLEVMLPPALRERWWVKSAIAGDRDLLDGVSEFTPGFDVKDVVVTLSNRRPRVTGTLKSATGPIGPEYALVVFSTDSRSWSATSRRTHITRPATDGAFEVLDLPPGEYFFAIVTDINRDELTTPLFFERLTPAAIRVTIGEGDQRQDLTIR